MRSRNEIKRQLSRADDPDSFNGGHDAISQELILEVLLDIRELLTPVEIHLEKPTDLKFIDLD